MMNDKIETVKNVLKATQIDVSVYEIPTQTPEADGTLQWNCTSLVLVEIEAGGIKSLGYTYGSAAVGFFIERELKKFISDVNLLDVPSIHRLLLKQIRNNGSCGIAMMAVSAIDIALWDLKAKWYGMPLCEMFGRNRSDMLLYGSGGFTNYSDAQLGKQFNEWEKLGMKYLKMKVGTEPEKDVNRVQAATDRLAPKSKLFVDANGAYSVKESIEKAKEFADLGVCWFEEPVSSDNLKGLQFIRERTSGEMNIAAGEYGYNISYFEHMITAGAVDVLQADATRCGGLTGFLNAGALAEAFQIPFSSHCAPSIHLHAALSLPAFWIAEYFFDHARIESLLFDGVLPPHDGCQRYDSSRPGLGLEFKKNDAEKFRI